MVNWWQNCIRGHPLGVNPQCGPGVPRALPSTYQLSMQYIFNTFQKTWTQLKQALYFSQNWATIFAVCWGTNFIYENGGDLIEKRYRKIIIVKWKNLQYLWKSLYKNVLFCFFLRKRHLYHLYSFLCGVISEEWRLWNCKSLVAWKIKKTNRKIYILWREHLYYCKIQPTYLLSSLLFSKSAF